MGWFKRTAEKCRPHGITLALAELEARMALDLSKLQSEITAQGALIVQVQTRVAALEAGAGSSADQDAVDALAATVGSNNAVLTTLASS